MDGERREFAAPWGRLLKGISLGAVLLFAGLVWAGRVGGAVFLILPLLLFAALPFIVRGYRVVDGVLHIRRLFWSTRFKLDALQSAETRPDAMQGSIRLCGNGGLFSFTGLYRSSALGRYRAFVNDWRRTVVLRFPNRTIVVSPDDPEAFVNALKMEQTEERT